MDAKKADIIARLQREILPLQGIRSHAKSEMVNIELGFMQAAFPNGCFPIGAVHEFLSASAEDMAASSGFISGILSPLMKKNGACVWVSSSRTIFPPALRTFDIEPDKIIFIDLKKEKDALWVMEESLKCNGLAAVVGEIKNIDFTASRRLQLAVEQSGVTGFIHRRALKNLNAIASVSRWKITSLPSSMDDDMPGVGFPRWNVTLEKIRNGKPGSWQLEWSGGKFRHIPPVIHSTQVEQKKKAG